MKFMAYIEKDVESGLYIGYVPGSMISAHTHGETLEELYANLQEVILLSLEELDDEDKKLMPEFIGVSQIEVVA